MPSRLLPNRTTVTEMGSFITRCSPKHCKSTLINDHRDTFPSKCVTVVKDIIARRRLDVNRETVILYASLYAFYSYHKNTLFIDRSASFTLSYPENRPESRTAIQNLSPIGVNLNQEMTYHHKCPGDTKSRTCLWVTV